MKKLFSLFTVAVLAIAATLAGCDGPKGDLIDKMARYVDQSRMVIYVALDAEDAAQLSIVAPCAAALPMSWLLTDSDIAVAHAPNIADLRSFEAFAANIFTGMISRVVSADGVDVLSFYTPADIGFVMPIYSVANPEPGIFVVGHRVNVLKHLSDKPIGLSIEEKVRIRKFAKENNAVFFNQNGTVALIAIDGEGVHFNVKKYVFTEDVLNALPGRIVALDSTGELSVEEIAEAMKKLVYENSTYTLSIDTDLAAKLIPAAIAQLPQDSPATRMFLK